MISACFLSTTMLNTQYIDTYSKKKKKNGMNKVMLIYYNNVILIFVKTLII